MRGWWIAVVVVAWSAVAGATRRGYTCHGQRCVVPLAAEVTVGALQMQLSDRAFSGSGQPAGPDGKALGPSLRLGDDGRALGLTAPVVVAWQLHYLWLTPWHFAFGGTFGGLDGNADGAQPRLGGQSLGGSLTGALFGPELAVVFAHGPLELRGSIAAGYRTIGLPITSFVKVPCGKGGYCYPTLGDDEFFLEPRATVAVHFASSITVGAYAGGDLTGGMGWTAGGLVGIALPDWRARAEVQRHP